MATWDLAQHPDAPTRWLATLLPLLRRFRRLPLAVRMALTLALVTAIVAIETMVPALARYPLLAFVPASIVAGLTLGRGCGVLAAVLSAVVVDILFMEPAGGLVALDAGRVAVLGLFLLVTISTAVAFDALFGALEDLTRTAAHLREGEARLRVVTSNARVGLVVVSHEHLYRFANQAYADILGLENSDLAGRHVRDVLPTAYDQIAPRMERAFAGELVSAELTLPGPEGERRYSVAYQPSTEADGSPVVIIVVHEITDRVRAQAQLAQSEERLRLATDHAEVGFWDVDLGQDRLVWPTRVKAMFGISADAEVSMADFYAGLHSEDRDATILAFQQACDPGLRALYDVEYRTVGKEDGAIRWVAAKGRGLFDEAGQCRRIVGIAMDVSARKDAEQRVREYADELATLLDAVPAAIWIARDPGALQVDGNRLAREILGPRVPATTADVAAAVRSFRRLGSDGAEIPASELPVQKAARGVLVRDFEETVVVEEGGTIHLIGNAVPLLDAEGRPRGSVAAFVDVTALKRAEAGLQAANETLEQRVDERTAELREANSRLARETAERLRAEADLHQVQRMETIGQLTGGVAHDFNNLLTPIMGSLDIIRRRVTLDARTDRLLGGAMEAAERAKTLVARLLAFARRQTLEAKPVDLGHLVEGMRDLVGRSLGPQIEVTVGIPGALPPAKVDPSQIEVAVLNLCVNARDAMPDGGQLHISAREEAVGAEAGLEPRRYVVLTVADTGAGMDTATLGRAVEPFFTTKPRGRGTGLGLSMVHGLAAQSGGRLALQSELGRGTRAEIWLPVAQEAAAAIRGDADTLVGAPFEATVLLVDDEDLVRLGTAEMLRDLGYTVAEADGGAVALDLLRGGLMPDILVTDYLMPGMNGVDLAATVRRQRPDLPALLITGYAHLAEGVADDLPRLTKPFRQADLAQRVAQLLPIRGRDANASPPPPPSFETA